MAELAEGRGFLLQGGDCAESFDDPVAEQVAGIVGLFDAMAERLRPVSTGPLVEIARIAGQFAKPRSATVETHDGVTLPAYRGDIVNGIGFDRMARVADPLRMIRAHMQSVGTAASLAAARGSGAPIFTSHEALLLPYEEALTRRDPAGRWWATSGHMLWLGDRTRQLDGAHVEYLRGIENVVGVKCGPSLTPEELLRLVDRLDPRNRAGKLVLIGRFGAKQIGEALPPLMRAIREAGRSGRLDDRPDARQHVDERQAQGPPPARYPRRDRRLLRHCPRRGRAWRRAASGNERARRDRMHRRARTGLDRRA